MTTARDMTGKRNMHYSAGEADYRCRWLSACRSFGSSRNARRGAPPGRASG